MSGKTDAEIWAEFDAMAARRRAFEQRPWGAKEYLLAYLYYGLLIGIGWGTVALGGFIIRAVLA